MDPIVPRARTGLILGKFMPPHRGHLHLVDAALRGVDELACGLGARHVAVDVSRSAVPVSGTAIREEPLKHWDFIPEPVRPYFARRVVVTGSESTGKTMLAARLAAHLGTVWTPEYARGYLDAKPAPLDCSDIEPIARGQRALEEDGARRANRVLIQDTDLLSTCIYAEHYYGACPPSVRRALRPPDLYLLLGIDVPWVPDPQRDRGHIREHMHALFRDAVRASGAPFVEVTGGWDERFQRAAAAVESILESGGLSNP